MVWVYSDRRYPRGWACIEYGSVLLVKTFSHLARRQRSGAGKNLDQFDNFGVARSLSNNLGQFLGHHRLHFLADELQKLTMSTRCL